VANVAAGYEVDYVFGYVGGVVADAFEIFGYEDELEGGEDLRRIFHHVGEQFAEELIAEAIDLVVAAENALGEVLIGAHQSVQTIADHGFGELAHARQINVGLDLRVAKDARGGLRDVDGLVADTLEVAINARNREKEAKIGGDRLLRGEQALDALINFNLHFVDGVFLRENRFGEMLFGIEDGVHGLVDGAFGKASHPEEALFQFFEIMIKMSFHISSILSQLAKIRRQMLRDNPILEP
jgi:hypothetical protein